MGRKVDYESLVGRTVGRLKIIKYLGDKKYECECECGNIIEKSYVYLIYDKSQCKSCGCWASERTKEFNLKTKKAVFDNEINIVDNSVFIKSKKKNEEFVYEFDVEILDLLKKLNCRVQTDCRGYAFISLPYDNEFGFKISKQLFLHNIICFGIEYYLKNNPPIVDHIDTNITNNKRENLRITDRSGNAKNANIRKDNTTGIKGINIQKQRNNVVIQARVQLNKQRVRKIFDFSLDGLKESIDWIYETRNELHGKFSNHGSKYIGMSEEEIKEDMIKTFIENIPKEYIDIFNKNIK